MSGYISREFIISSLSGDNHPEWSDFVDSNDNATIFHTLQWKEAIENTFGYKPIYLLIKDQENRLIGISPSFLVRTLTGKAIISQPFFEYGGPLINNGFEDAYRDVFKFYKNLIDLKKAKYIELRCLPNLNCVDDAMFIRQFKAYDFYIDIEGKDFEKDIWFGLYTKKSRVRNSVGKARDFGLKVVESRDIDEYYRLYKITVERLGSPPYSKSLFKNIEKFLGNMARFTFAYFEGRPISAMMSFLFNKRDLMVGLVSDEAYQEYRANDLLYNEQIEYATRNGFNIVDFGRTRPDSDYERYKKKWGASKCDLVSYVYPSSAAESVNPYKFYLSASKITTKMPWILTRTGIGSHMIKYFP